MIVPYGSLQSCPYKKNLVNRRIVFVCVIHAVCYDTTVVQLLFGSCLSCAGNHVPIRELPLGGTLYHVPLSLTFPGPLATWLPLPNVMPPHWFDSYAPSRKALLSPTMTNDPTMYAQFSWFKSDFSNLPFLKRYANWAVLVVENTPCFVLASLEWRVHVFTPTHGLLETCRMLIREYRQSAKSSESPCLHLMLAPSEKVQLMSGLRSSRFSLIFGNHVQQRRRGWWKLQLTWRHSSQIESHMFESALWIRRTRYYATVCSCYPMKPWRLGTWIPVEIALESSCRLTHTMKGSSVGIVLRPDFLFKSNCCHDACEFRHGVQTERYLSSSESKWSPSLPTLDLQYLLGLITAGGLCLSPSQLQVWPLTSYRTLKIKTNFGVTFLLYLLLCPPFLCGAF